MPFDWWFLVACRFSLGLLYCAFSGLLGVARWWCVGFAHLCVGVCCDVSWVGAIYILVVGWFAFGFVGF